MDTTSNERDNSISLKPKSETLKIIEGIKKRNNKRTHLDQLMIFTIIFFSALFICFFYIANNHHQKISSLETHISELMYKQGR